MLLEQPPGIFRSEPRGFAERLERRGRFFSAYMAKVKEKLNVQIKAGRHPHHQRAVALRRHARSISGAEGACVTIM